jgi:oxygen-dependent protoporphyrinogen oxidase
LSEPARHRVLIIGAGISGLSLAYRLQQLVPTAEVLVLEERDRPGGTIWTERRDGFQIEIGANGFLDSKPSTISLCRDLGLADRLVTASESSSRNRYLFLGDRLRPLPSSFFSFLKSDLLSWKGKLAILTEHWRQPRRDRADESIDAFARRRAGAEAAELADAIVTGIHAGDPTLLSVRAAFPRLPILEAQYGSVSRGLNKTARQRRAQARARGEPYRGTALLSFRQGLRFLIESIFEQLVPKPLLGIRVRAIQSQAGESGQPTSWTVLAEGQDRWQADAVALTCPAYRQASLLAELDNELAERIAGIVYNRIAVVALGYRQADIPISFDGFGFITPERTRRDLLGVQWCSSVFPDRAPAGTVLLRALGGGWHRPDVVDWDDTRLLQAARVELRRAMNIKADPVFHHIVRWDRAIPQYHLGHVERVRWIRDRLTRHPGLFVGGNAFDGVAMNDCAQQGELLAHSLRQYLLYQPSAALLAR